MARLVLGVAGAAVGFAFGGIQGAQLGFAVGSAIGGQFEPAQKVQGPRLADLKAPAATYGSVIPYIEGHPRIGGVWAWCSDKREIATTTNEGGKGGPGVDSTTYTYEMDVLIVFCEGMFAGPRRAWNNGKLCWTRADDADASSLDASGETPMWRELRVLDGGPTQLPDPTYEAAFGVGNVPAMRDRGCVVIEGMNLGNSGQPPLLTFEVCSEADTITGGFLEDFTAGLTPYAPGGGGSIDTTIFSITSTEYGPSLHVRGEVPVSSVSKSIGRSVSAGPVTSFSWRFRVDYLGDPGETATPRGPAVKIQVSGSGTLVDFYSCGGKFSDPLQRCALTFAGVSIYASVGAPAVGVWYQGVLEIRSPTSVRFRLMHNADVLFEHTFTGTYTTWTPTSITFDDQFSFSTSDLKPSATFDDIRLGTPGDRLTLVDVALDQVVLRQCERGGLQASQVDVTDLATKYVHSMALGQVTAPRGVIQTLMQAYLFDAVESDKLRFKLRGGAAALTVPFNDLAATTGEPVEALPLTSSNDLEIPQQVTVKFSNVDNDYQDGAESSDRLLRGGNGVQVIEVPIGLTPTEAKRLADVLVMGYAAESLRVGPFSLMREYAAIEPTDVVLLQDEDGSTWRTRLQKRTSASGVLTYEGVVDDASILVSGAVTSGGYQNSSIVRPVPDTDMELLDIPILRDVDDVPGFYVAAHGTGDAWPGYALFKSVDDVTFEKVLESTASVVFGLCDTTLGDFTGGNVFDEVNVLSVNVGSGTLASSTATTLLAGVTNAALVGSEIIQFRTATQTGDGTYDLSGLLRGRRGTEWAMSSHSTTERFVLLEAASLRHVTDELAELDVPRFWKGVTFKKTVSSVSSVDFTDTGVGLKPFAPTDLAIDHASTTLAATWHRRSRLSSRFLAEDVDPPLGEATESYDVELRDASDVIVQSVNVTTNAWDSGLTGPFTGYSITVYQRSATVGRGYPAVLEL